jgi:predicted  nucleic acid-binding Zn-ribbon protein
MQEVIEKLLILQDRDRRILRTKEQLARIEPERAMLQAQAEATKAGADAAKLRLKQNETERKQLELEVETKKSQIEKYALQQFQTKKNEEYRALGHEMDSARAAIVKIEDQQLELMQRAEDLQREVTAATRQSDEVRKSTESQLADLAAREKNLQAELAELESNRARLTEGVDSSVLSRYDRLLKNKGDNVIVGIEHGVCGGCHMKFPTQITIACQGGKELVSCPNCGRLLYYTRDMDLVVAE